jgi:hypothetical protein
MSGYPRGRADPRHGPDTRPTPMHGVRQMALTRAGANSSRNGCSSEAWGKCSSEPAPDRDGRYRFRPNPVSEPDIAGMFRAGWAAMSAGGRGRTALEPMRARRWPKPASANALRRGCGRLLT